MPDLPTAAEQHGEASGRAPPYSADAAADEARRSNRYGIIVLPRFTRLGGIAISEMWGHMRTRDGDVCTVVLRGELDISARDTLLDLFTTELEAPAVQTVRVDLAAVTFIDSTVLSVLVSGHLRAQDLNRSFAIVNESGLVRRVLDTTGLLSLLTPHAPAQDVDH